jgi:branched-chain amino acid transport system substrate-binding protein
MRNAIKKIIFLVLALFSASLTAGAAEKPVFIGVPLPLTGSFSEFGIIMKNSFEMAKEDINKAGGINGRPIELLFADDKGQASSVTEAFNRLTGAGAIMLTGGYASDSTYEMARAAEKKDIPFLICTASADKITQKGWENIYRLNPPISEYTKGLEDFWLKNFKPRSMAIIYEDSMFGTDGALRMMEFCRENAAEIRMYIGYDKNKLDPIYLRSMLAPLAEDPPDVIYMISYLEDAVALVRELKGLKLPSLICGGAGGFTLDEFIRRSGESANYILTAALWSGQVKYPGSIEYNNRYVQQYGKAPDYHGAEAYSALLVAADALKRAASFSPEDIREALNRTYMKTPFGPVRFYSYDDFERQNSVNTLVLQVIHGKFETIWPPETASAPFTFPGKN